MGKKWQKVIERVAVILLFFKKLDQQPVDDLIDVLVAVWLIKTKAIQISWFAIK